MRDLQMENARLVTEGVISRHNSKRREEHERADGTNRYGSTDTSDARPRGSSPVRNEPAAIGGGLGVVERACEQRADDGPAHDGDGQPQVQRELRTDAPDLAGHSGEHGAQEQPAEPDSSAGVQAAEGAVREGGE